MKKWQTGLLYVALLLIFYLYRDEILNWMQHGEAPLYLVFIIAMGFIVVPILPYKVIIGVLGFKYGLLIGALISWSAASLASVLLFILARTLFQKQARAYLMKFSHLEKLHQRLEKHPFMTILFARLMPFIPQAVINIYPAILSIKLLPYASASALGKIPAMLLFAFIGSSLTANSYNVYISLGVYGVFLLLIYLTYRIWKATR